MANVCFRTVGPEGMLPELTAWLSPCHWVCPPASSPDIQALWELLFNSSSLNLLFALTLLHLPEMCLEVLDFPSHLNVQQI